MSEQISVTKIVIKIGKKSLELSPEEMKELRDILDSTFPKEKTVFVPSQPIVIDRPVYPPRNWPWKTWCEPTWSADSVHKMNSTMCIQRKEDNA